MGECKYTYIQECEERDRKGVQNVVDLGEQIIGSVERPPPLEDGVGNFEDAIVDFGVVRRQARNKILLIPSASLPRELRAWLCSIPRPVSAISPKSPSRRSS